MNLTRVWHTSLPLLIKSGHFCRHFRPICTTNQLRTVYDPNVFCDPIVDMEELNKTLPMSEDDPRYGMHPKPMGTSQTPVFYRDKIVDMMINVMKTTNDRDITKDGVYGALELIKRIQYGKWFHEKDEAKRAKIILDPIEVANLAILNCRPVMELRKMTKSGTVYQVPFSISEAKATFRAIKMMRQLLAQKKRQKRKLKPFKTRLAHELLEAMQGEGLTVQAKQELHRLCEQNRAYSSMRHF